MARKKKVEPMTVIEFQSYLKGIVDFSGDDWHPSKEQWTQLFDHIQNLKVEVPMVQRPVQGQPQYQPIQQPHQQPIHQPVSALDANGDPEMQEFIPVNNMARNDMRTIIPKVGASKVAGGGQVPSSGVTVVTPNKEADDTKSDFS